MSRLVPKVPQGGGRSRRPCSLSLRSSGDSLEIRHVARMLALSEICGLAFDKK